jgi:hypothetical protein
METEQRIKSFKFIDTDRFSPVANGNDLPWKEDLYHVGFSGFNPDLLKDDSFITDVDWWETQYDRCINGYTIPNAIIEGGDFWVNGKKYFVDEKTNEIYSWGNNIEYKDDNSIYLKELDITIKDKTVSITGRHYFYLNFWVIKRRPPDGGTKKVLPPRFTDLSFENWWIRDLANKLMKDILWAKSRQKGFSEEEAADTAYDLLFIGDTQTTIIGGEEFYNRNTMEMVRRGISRLQHTQFYKEFKRGGDNKEYLGTKNTGAEIFSRTCKNNPEAVSGLTPSKAHLEEIGIFTRGLLKQVLDTIDASLEAEGEFQGEKTGKRVYTGTGGDMEQGVADMEDMLYNPVEYNLVEFENVYEESDIISKIARFVPACKFKVVDNDGNSKMEEGIKYILTQIDKARPDRKYTLTVMNPLKPSKIFMSKEGGYFGPIISQWCNERKAYIMNHRESKIMKHYEGRWLDPKDPMKGVEFTPSEDGPFMISEPPEIDKEGNVYEGVYRVGTDSYDQPEAAFSTSLGACWVKKGFINANKTYNKYVAGVLERPTESIGGPDLFYEHTAMLSVAFNAPNLIEYSKILIIDWYVKNGFAGYVKLRPEFVTASMVMNSKATNRYGIDPSTKGEWLKMQKKFLSDRRNIDNCDFPVLLTAWSNFKYDPTGKKYNCDNTIATSLCTVCEEDEKGMYDNTQNIEKPDNRPIHYQRDRSGNLIMI